LRKIVEGAPVYLKAGGWLLMEHGYDQAAAVRTMLHQYEWREVQSWKDLASIERVSGATRPAHFQHHPD
jgi:release factor glutamine methyltransferase